jgi:hypothetical protein
MNHKWGRLFTGILMAMTPYRYAQAQAPMLTHGSLSPGEQKAIAEIQRLNAEVDADFLPMECAVLAREGESNPARKSEFQLKCADTQTQAKIVDSNRQAPIEQNTPGSRSKTATKSDDDKLVRAHPIPFASCAVENADGSSFQTRKFHRERPKTSFFLSPSGVPKEEGLIFRQIVTIISQRAQVLTQQTLQSAAALEATLRGMQSHPSQKTDPQLREYIHFFKHLAQQARYELAMALPTKKYRRGLGPLEWSLNLELRSPEHDYRLYPWSEMKPNSPEWNHVAQTWEKEIGSLRRQFDKMTPRQRVFGNAVAARLELIRSKHLVKYFYYTSTFRILRLLRTGQPTLAEFQEATEQIKNFATLFFNTEADRQKRMESKAPLKVSDFEVLDYTPLVESLFFSDPNGLTEAYSPEELCPYLVSMAAHRDNSNIRMMVGFTVLGAFTAWGVGVGILPFGPVTAGGLALTGYDMVQLQQQRALALKGTNTGFSGSHVVRSDLDVQALDEAFDFQMKFNVATFVVAPALSKLRMILKESKGVGAPIVNSPNK